MAYQASFISNQNGILYTGSGEAETLRKTMKVDSSGHHVLSVRKSQGRPFQVSRTDKTRPTIFPRGDDPAHAHWRLHDAERSIVGPRQGDFIGTDEELFNAYRQAYEHLDDMRVDVRTPGGEIVLGENVSPRDAVDLIENWLRHQGQ